MGKVKRIGVLTSGGDAPGMNAAVRAVVRTAAFYNLEVIGIYRGYEGLMEKNFKPLGIRDVGNILGEGGTMLYSARSKAFATEEGVQKGVSNLKEAGIDGLVCIGGDGTFRGARDLSLAGIPCIGVPGTIDNDIASTEFAIGFDTALNTIVEAVDKFRDTSESHNRCAVIEVMGRQSGELAVHAGIACGAEAVLTPEIPYDIQKDVIDRIIDIKKTGKSNFTVLTAEGVTGSVEGKDGFDVFSLARLIEEKTGVESRGAVLAHMQRGGAPTGRDRVLASMFGERAVQLLSESIGNRIVAQQQNRIVDIDIVEALEMKKAIDPELIELAKVLSI